MFGIGPGVAQAIVSLQAARAEGASQAQRGMIAPARVRHSTAATPAIQRYRDDAQRAYNANVTRQTAIAQEMLDGQQWG